jgi:type IV pilus assembly protein PilC
MSHSKNKHLSSKEKARIYSILSVILKTGVSLPVALQSQYDVSKNAREKLIFRRLVLGADKGRNISESLSAIAGFSKMDISLIKAAEQTGNVPGILKDLAEYNLSLDMFLHRMKRAVFIPGATFTAACFIAALPALVKYGFARFLFEALIYLAVAAFVLGGAFILLRGVANNAGRNRKAAAALYSMPGWGTIARKMDLYRFARIMSLSISAGLGISECLRLSSVGVQSCILKGDIIKAEYLIEKRGMTLREAFAESEALGGLVKKMLAGGEISGTIGVTTAKLADYFHDELNNDITVMVRMVNIASTLLVALFLIARIFMLAGDIFPVKSI